jgi:hypothetical protein
VVLRGDVYVGVPAHQNPQDMPVTVTSGLEYCRAPLVRHGVDVDLLDGQELLHNAFIALACGHDERRPAVFVFLVLVDLVIAEEPYDFGNVFVFRSAV